MSKNALVFSGGGSRGSYQIGVWRALIELGIDIHIVTGTSVGALNAVLIALGDFDNAYTMWEQITTSTVLSVDIDEEADASQKINTMLLQFFQDYTKNRGLDSYPLKSLIDKHCDEEKLRNCGIECGFMVFDKNTLKPVPLFLENVAKGKLAEYLLASASFFPAMKSCEIDGSEYIDGGYGDNLPVSLAVSKGADHIIAVDLESPGVVKKKEIESFANIKVIRSYWNLGPILLFEKKQNLYNMRLGYLDTMKAFNVFEGIAYTFVKNSLSDFIQNNREDILLQNKMVGLVYGINKSQKPKLDNKDKVFFLKLESYLNKKYNIEFNFSYNYFFKVCAECAGEIFELSPEVIYSLDVFNNKLMSSIEHAYLVNEDEEDAILPTHHMLRKSLALLDKKNRTIYIGTLIKMAVIENKPIELLPLTFIAIQELLGAYYIALIS